MVSVADWIAMSKTAGRVQGRNNQVKAAYSPALSAAPQPFYHKNDRRNALNSRQLAGIHASASPSCTLLLVWLVYSGRQNNLQAAIPEHPYMRYR